MNVLDYTQPKVVLTAPDGSQLWIDPLASQQAGETGGTSLWPQGFKVTLAAGATPTAPNVTDSPAKFISGQGLALLQAPGPLGISWLVWTAITIAVPILIYRARK